MDSTLNLDLQDQDGYTALMHAAQAGHISCVKALLANNAMVDQVTTDGETALMLAAEQGHVACVMPLAKISGR